MSQENVEVVRRWLTARNAGPKETLAAVAGFLDADVDYYPVRKFPAVHPCHGLEEWDYAFGRPTPTRRKLRALELKVVIFLAKRQQRGRPSAPSLRFSSSSPAPGVTLAERRPTF